MAKKTHILFLLKQGNLYGSYTTTKNSGLHNAIKILIDQLERAYNIRCVLEICVDGNEVDKYVTKYKPNNCILEALWVTPTKVAELCKLHRATTFFTRIHSRIPFLALEGNAMTWLKELTLPANSYIAFNSEETNNDFLKLGYEAAT